MRVLEFFVPSKRLTKGGRKASMVGLNELIDAERSGTKVGNDLKRRTCANVQSACEAAMWECRWKAPRGKSVVVLTFVERDRSRDPDNIFGGAKYILDGITMPRAKKSYGAGAIVDDSQKYIELVFGDILVDKDRPGCWVRIEADE